MSGFDKSVFLQPKRDLAWKILIAFVGDALMGFGIALNSCVGLGSDPISVFADGLHSFFHIDLGMAFNVANYTLFAIILLFARRYINIGTLIHTLPLGFFVSVGVNLYTLLSPPSNVIFRAAVAIVACILLFFGTAIFIAVEIGLDPWTGLAMLLRDKTRFEYKVYRVVIDVTSLVVGFLLGGTVGITTAVAAIFGGPIIQAFANFIKKSILSKFNFKNN